MPIFLAALASLTLSAGASQDTLELPMAEVHGRSPGGVQTYTREQLRDYAPLTLGDMLRRIPGVLVEGPEGKDVSYRGLDKEYTQVLIDGLHVPDGGEKRELAADRIPADLVEKVQVLPAGDPRLPGQGVAGTLQILTRRPVAAKGLALRWNGEGQGESMAGQSVGIRLDRRWDDWSLRWNGTAGLRPGSKDKTKRVNGSTGNLESIDGEEETRENLEWSHNPELRWNHQNFEAGVAPLWIGAQNEKQKTLSKSSPRTDGTMATTTENEVERKRLHQWGIRPWLRRDGPLGGTRAQFSWQEYREEKDKTNQALTATGLQGIRKGEDETKEDREAVGTLEQQYQRGAWEMDAGGLVGLKDRWKRKLATQNGLLVAGGTKDRYGVEETELTGFLRGAWHPGPWELSLGLRLETVRGKGGLLGAEPSADILPRVERDWDASPLPYARLGWKKGSFNLSQSVSRSVRRPKFDDIIPFRDTKSGTLTDPDQIGNPDLMPERAWAFEGEAGYELKYFQATIRGWYRLFEDLYEPQSFRDSSGRFYTRPENFGRGDWRGAEAILRTTIPLGAFRTGLELSGAVSHSEIWREGTPPMARHYPYQSQVGAWLEGPKGLWRVDGQHRYYPDKYQENRKPDGTVDKNREGELQRFDFSMQLKARKGLRFIMGVRDWQPYGSKTVNKEVYAADGSLLRHEYERESQPIRWTLSGETEF